MGIVSSNSEMAVSVLLGKPKLTAFAKKGVAGITIAPMDGASTANASPINAWMEPASPARMGAASGHASKACGDCVVNPAQRCAEVVSMRIAILVSTKAVADASKGHSGIV